MYDDNQPLVAVRIKDGIFCGNVTAAYDEDFLVMNKVTHIINCAGGESKDLYKHSGIQYLNFPWSLPTNHTSACTLFDNSDKNIESIVRFVDETLSQGECVLIQSFHGRSRACVVCAAYFIIKYRWTLDHALDFIAMAHEDMDILPQFRKQLEMLYQRHEVPPSNTGRALDIFHPEVDDVGFALDNEQWMLRNTYVNGLVMEAQEKTDLYKVTSARVQLAEPNPKSAAKRRRRITFCDTKQGTSVACMWTQPVVQHRAATPTIQPPQTLGPSIVSRPGTPLLNRIEGDADAHVHTVNPNIVGGGSSSSYSNKSSNNNANIIKLQLRSSIQQQQQGPGGQFSQGLNLRYDSPSIGSGPALVATGSLSSGGGGVGGAQQLQQSSVLESGGYNQTVSRVLPSQQQQQQQQHQQAIDDFASYKPGGGGSGSGSTTGSGSSFVGNTASSSQPQYSDIIKQQEQKIQQQQQQQTQQQQQQQQPPQAPSAANIAASLGTTGQGSLITLRGGAPLSLSVGAAAGGSSSSGAAQQQQQQKDTSQMRPIPDASSTVRPYSNVSTAANTTTTSGSNTSMNVSKTNTTTPARQGPVVRSTGGSSGLQPGHNRSNPFTLPASGRTVHRGSPLPMQRNTAGGGGGSTQSAFANRTASGGGGTTTSKPLFGSSGVQRTNSPIRGSGAGTGGTNSPIRSSGYGAGGGGITSSRVTTNSPRPTNSPRGNSPMSAGGSGGVIRGGSPSAMNRNVASSSSTSGGGGGIGSSGRGNSPSSALRPAWNTNTSSMPGARPPSPGRGAPSSSNTGVSMVGGSSTSTSLWSSSLLPAHSYGNTSGGAYAATGGTGSSLLRPRAGSPIVRSNSPMKQSSQQQSQQLRPSNIPSASSGVSSLSQQQPPPSRPAVVSAQLSSYPSSSQQQQRVQRTNSPMAQNRAGTGTQRTNSPLRNTTNASSSSSMIGRGNSPMSRGGPASGGSLAEQFLLRSNNNNTLASGGGGGRQPPPSTSFGSGRNSPMVRR